MQTLDAIKEGLTADEQAVASVIQAETTAFFSKDFEGFSRCWTHEPSIRRLGWWTRGGVTDRRGWDELGARTKRAMEDNPGHNRSAEEVLYDNFVIRVSGDMAFASYDQYAPETGEPDFDMPGCSREARVLIRQDGDWRIVFHTYIHQTVQPTRSAMFRLDKDANISWLNSAAETALRNAKSGLAVSQGRLRAIDDRDNRTLRTAVAQASARDDLLDGGRVAVPIILDLGEDSEVVCVCWVLTEGAGSGAVLVVLNNLTFANEQLDTASGVFGYSPGQHRLAEQIVAGHDLVSAAGLLGISVNTARTHLQRIFEKTGVRSQIALVRTLLSVERPS